MRYVQVVARGPINNQIFDCVSFTRNPAPGAATPASAPALAPAPALVAALSAAPPAAAARPSLGLTLVPAQANGSGARVASVTAGSLAASAGHPRCAPAASYCHNRVSVSFRPRSRHGRALAVFRLSHVACQASCRVTSFSKSAPRSFRLCLTPTRSQV